MEAVPLQGHLRAQVLELIKKKAKGQEIVVDEAEKEPEKVVDLMAALEASLQSAKKPTKKARTTKTAKKKSAA